MAKSKQTPFERAIVALKGQDMVVKIGGAISTLNTSVRASALKIGLYFAAVVAGLKPADKGLKGWIAANNVAIDNTTASRMMTVARACYGLSAAELDKLPGSFEAIAIMIRFKHPKTGKRPFDCEGGAKMLLMARVDISTMSPGQAREAVKVWEKKRAASKATPTKDAVRRATVALGAGENPGSTSVAGQQFTAKNSGSKANADARRVVKELLVAQAATLTRLAAIVDSLPVKGYTAADAIASLEAAHQETETAFDAARVALKAALKAALKKTA